MTSLLGVRVALARGVYRHHGREDAFFARIRFQGQEDCVSYGILIKGADSSFLGYCGRAISKRTLPTGPDAFEIALSHALECLRRIRWRRRRRFLVQEAAWATPTPDEEFPLFQTILAKKDQTSEA